MAEIGARRPSRSLSDEVAIVGAGFAGLIAAYRLRQADVIAKVYEGDTRVGGRAWTLRGFFNDDQIAEAHAEFIDGYHYTMIRIAQEAGLELENLNDIPGGLRTTFEIDGAPYPFWRIVADLIPVVRAAIRDGARAGWDTTFYESTPYGRTLDAMSVTEWIEARISGGMSSRIGQLLDVHIRNEYGMEPAQLSSLNIVYGLSAMAEDEGGGRGGRDGPGQSLMHARRRSRALSDDEGPLAIWHIKGGTDLLATRLAGALPGQIELNHRLVSAATEGARVRLTFDTPGGTVETRVDRVVLALPFSVLREVDLSGLDLRQEKRNAIDQLGIATNSKLIMQFSDRHWRTLGKNGDIWSDRDFQATWDGSSVQPGAAGILVDYLGGEFGANFDQGTPEERVAAFLADIEPILPGLGDKWNGRVFRVHPTSSPLLRGAYPAYALGQYSMIRGLEPEVEGNTHFAGDHTSLRFQGFLEGAAESGERAAGEILAAMRQRSRR